MRNQFLQKPQKIRHDTDKAAGGTRGNDTTLKGYIDNVFFLMGWVGGLLPMCKEKETEIAGVQQKRQ
jgi:hypothetical protein